MATPFGHSTQEGKIFVEVGKPRHAVSQGSPCIEVGDDRDPAFTRQSRHFSQSR